MHFLYYSRKKIKNIEPLFLLGGKGESLYNLNKESFIRVPYWGALTTEFFKMLSEKYGLSVVLDNAIADIHLLRKKDSEACEHNFARKIQKFIRSLKFSRKDIKYLRKIYNRISYYGVFSIAVRSSAIDEDGIGLSFAGQMDTFLNIKNFSDFIKAVLGCWSSLFTERAIIYRKKNKVNIFTIKISVIVQRMIRADRSGVIFTANTITGNKKEILISGVFGLGEGIVSGKLNADTFILTENGNIISIDIGDKKKICIYAKNGTKFVKNSPEYRKKQVFTESELKKLTIIAKRIEKLYNTPLDIEFATKGSKIFILQVRPITVLPEYHKKRLIVWDNSNIVESYSGITLPLTFSFIRIAYSSVYRQFCKAVGISESLIQKNNYIFDNMLGHINGRVYYNLINWYRLIALLPGFKYNKSFMEEMMGLRVIKDYIQPEPVAGFFEKYFIHLPGLIKVGVRMLYLHLTLSKRIKKFFDNFYQVYNKYRKYDFTKYTTTELKEIIDDIQEKILEHWKEPILNDLKCMIFYGVLKRLVTSWVKDKSGNLHNELLAGQGDIKSKLVVTELFRLAIKIKKDKELSTAFMKLPTMEILKLLRLKKYKNIKMLFDAYLYEYGVRSIDEMKLESIPVKDNPDFFIAIIKNYIAGQIIDPKEQKIREQGILKKAEKRVSLSLRRKRVMIFFSKRNIFNIILKHTRRAIRDRENQRFCRSEVYSLIRDIMLAIGNLWHKKKALKFASDIFYLTWDEIWNYYGGTSVTEDLKTLVNIRKKEYTKYKKDIADHIETIEEVYLSSNLYSINKEKNNYNSKKGVLKGIGCGIGTITGKAVIIDKPDASIKLSNDILVAKETDPGWVVLFPSISGLIVEKGSVLSHTAIVAREMGIPAIFGVRGAVKIIKNGQIISMDGAKGEIKL